MIEAIKKHKRIVAAVVILILTAIIEIECNYQAIRHGYTDLDLSEYITEKTVWEQKNLWYLMHFRKKII